MLNNFVDGHIKKITPDIWPAHQPLMEIFDYARDHWHTTIFIKQRVVHNNLLFGTKRCEIERVRINAQ